MEDSKLFSGKIMDAQTVARMGYRGLMTNKTVVIPGLRNKILVEGKICSKKDGDANSQKQARKRTYKLSPPPA
jgi:short-subunit dehydrogenase